MLDLLRTKGGASLYDPLIEWARLACLQLARVEGLRIGGDEEYRVGAEVREGNDEDEDGSNGALH